MPLIAKALVAALGLAAVGRAGNNTPLEDLKPKILADTNRDGVTDSKDFDARTGLKSPFDGALMLANIGATLEDCRRDENCNDARGDAVLNEKYLADVITEPLDVGDGVTGKVVVFGSAALSTKTRIFYKDADNKWVFVKKDREFTADQLRKGLKLGVDARDVRRPNGPNGWNGMAVLKFQLYENGRMQKEDSVTLVVAPVLTHHALQKPEQVYTIDAWPGWTDQQQFNKKLDEFSSAAGLSSPVYKFPASQKIWTQDFFEPGYMSMPGKDGPVSLRIMIRSSQISRKGDQGKLVFTELRNTDVGAVWHDPTPWLQGDRKDGGGLDSLGNLETIPPHTNPKTGNKYPAGRPFMGVDPDELNRKPFIINFLNAQGNPQGKDEDRTVLEVDSGWLLNGHVDEFLQFLPDPDPAKKQPGRFLLAHSAPRAALKVFRDVQKDHGEEKIYSRKTQLYDRDVGLSESDKKLLDQTINGLLTADLVELNEGYAKRIDDVVGKIMQETGLTEKDIIEIPVLYTSEKQVHPRSLPVEEEGKFGRRGLGVASQAGERLRQLERRRVGDSKAVSVFPASPNGLVLGDDFLLLPDTFGPVINGHDILQDAVEKAYRDAGFKNINKMDDFFDHHTQTGDIHCGTNMARDASKKWW